MAMCSKGLVSKKGPAIHTINAAGERRRRRRKRVGRVRRKRRREEEEEEIGVRSAK